MATYSAIFVQNHVYWVEADNESEAESKAYEEFKSDMTSSVANCIYDEVIIDEVSENEEEK